MHTALANPFCLIHFPPPPHLRASLGCGSKRRRLESSPSNPEGPQVSKEEKDAFVKTLPQYYVTE